MLHVVVDAANVVGSRPDGWWRDRAGAGRRLAGRIVAVLVARPEDLVERLEGRTPTSAETAGSDLREAAVQVHLVLEGAASRVEDLPTHPLLDVVHADADGDSAIAELVGGLTGGGRRGRRAVGAAGGAAGDVSGTPAGWHCTHLTPAVPPCWRPAARLAALLAAVAVVAGCTGAAPGPAPEPAPPPPVPPAACALDPVALATDTGVAWTVDATTASDTRCVYTASNEALLTVVLESGAAAVALADLSAVCSGPATPVPAAGEGAFACALPEGGVFAARRTGDRLATVTASAVPTGATAEALVAAVVDQLSRVGA